MTPDRLAEILSDLIDVLEREVRSADDVSLSLLRLRMETLATRLRREIKSRAKVITDEIATCGRVRAAVETELLAEEEAEAIREEEMAADAGA